MAIHGFCLGKNRFRYRNYSPTCCIDTSPLDLTSGPPVEWPSARGYSPAFDPVVHLTAQTIMKRLRSLGINLLGARNTALQSLAAEVPPPLVAELLGYSYNVTQRHAEIAAQPWAGYVTSKATARHRMRSALLSGQTEQDVGKSLGP